MDILTFELDSRRYAFPADRIVQVVQMVGIAALPGSPPVVEGVVNVRGMLVPVFDLRARLGLPARPIDPSQHLVILTVGERAAAVRVDSTDDFLSVSDDDITRPDALSELGIGAGMRHVSGIAATVDGTTIIYDLAAFLSGTEAATLEEALAHTGG